MLIYAVIILAIMNITTFVTIGYHVYRSSDEQGLSPTGQIEGDTQAFSDRYFRDRLGLTSQQMTSFKEFSTGFRQHARSINQNLIQCRISMLEEMEMNEPDLMKLESLSDSIGTLHARLKHYTYGYYLNIREISSEDQKQELNNMFEEFFINDYRMGPQGGGRQQGRGPGFLRQTGNE